jgi:hypothetical protein
LCRFAWSLLWPRAKRKRRLTAGESCAIDRFDPLRLFIAQLLKFALPRRLGQPPVVLIQESEEQVDQSLGHLKESLDLLAELIVAPQKIRLGGEIMFDRFLNAGVEELGVRRGIKKTVEIARVVQNADIEFFSPAPI